MGAVDEVKEIQNSLRIDNNNILEDVKGFSNLEVVDYLSISSNDKIQNLEGLESVRQLVHLDLSRNTLLADCCHVLEDLEDQLWCTSYQYDRE